MLSEELTLNWRDIKMVKETLTYTHGSSILEMTSTKFKIIMDFMVGKTAESFEFNICCKICGSTFVEPEYNCDCEISTWIMFSESTSHQITSGPRMVLDDEALAFNENDLTSLEIWVSVILKTDYFETILIRAEILTAFEKQVDLVHLTLKESNEN